MSPSTFPVSTCMCSYILYNVSACTYVSHRMEAKPSVFSRAGMGEMLSFGAGKAPQDAWEPRVGLTHPSPPPWFFWEFGSSQEGFFCSLLAGFSGFSPSCFTFMCYTGSPGAAHSFHSHPQQKFPSKEGPRRCHFSLWQ